MRLEAPRGRACQPEHRAVFGPAREHDPRRVRRPHLDDLGRLAARTHHRDALAHGNPTGPGVNVRAPGGSERRDEGVRRVGLGRLELAILGGALVPSRAAARDLDARPRPRDGLDLQLLDLVGVRGEGRGVDHRLGRDRQRLDEALGNARRRPRRRDPHDHHVLRERRVLARARTPEDQAHRGARGVARRHDQRSRAGHQGGIARGVVEEELRPRIGERLEEVVDRGPRRAETVQADAEREPLPHEHERRAHLHARHLARAVGHERALAVRVRAPQELHLQRAPDDEGPFSVHPHVRRPLGHDRVVAQLEAVRDRTDLHGPAHPRPIEALRVGAGHLAHPGRGLELAEQDVHLRRVELLAARRHHRPRVRLGGPRGPGRAPLEHQLLGAVFELDALDVPDAKAREHVRPPRLAVGVGDARAIDEVGVPRGPRGEPDEHERRRRAARPGDAHDGPRRPPTGP